MVDEYQDTNGPQYEIVRALARRAPEPVRRRRRRPVDLRLARRRRREDPRLRAATSRARKVVRLETNYRSTEPILDAANRVIATTPSATRRRCAPRSAPGEPVRCMRARGRDRRGRARRRARSTSSCAPARRGLADFAILFRTQTQPRVFEAAAARARRALRARRRHVVLRPQGGARRARLPASSPRTRDDEMSLLRVINCPPRGVGKTTLDRVLEFATRAGHLGRARRSSARARSRACARAGGRAAAATLRDALDALGAEDPGRDARALARATSSRRSTTAARSSALYPDAETREDALGGRDGGRSTSPRTTCGATQAPSLDELPRGADARRATTSASDEDTKRQRRGHADDAARREGPRVPARLPRRRRGGHPAARALGRRGQRRGGAPPDVRRHHARADDTDDLRARAREVRHARRRRALALPVRGAGSGAAQGLPGRRGRGRGQPCRGERDRPARRAGGRSKTARPRRR